MRSATVLTRILAVAASGTALMVLVIGLLGCGGESDNPATTDEQGDTGDLRPTKPTDPRIWQELAEKAKAGPVAVIVTLDVSTRPEGELSTRERDAQRKRIKEVGDALLDELNGREIGRVRRFQEAPFVAMTVSAKALAALERSPNVGAIEEDTPAAIGD